MSPKAQKATKWTAITLAITTVGGIASAIVAGSSSNALAQPVGFEVFKKEVEDRFTIEAKERAERQVKQASLNARMEANQEALRAGLEEVKDALKTNTEYLNERFDCLDAKIDAKRR